MPPPTRPRLTASSGRKFASRNDSGSPTPRFNALIKQAYATGVASDMGVSVSKLERLVHAFVATRRTDEEFLGWLTEYQDPTGETAVWNVMKARGR